MWSYGMMGWRISVRRSALALGLGSLIAAPGPAGGQMIASALRIVDVPTAGLTPPGAFETQARLFPEGGVEMRIDIGLASWLALGGAYGGQGIIASGQPDWNPEPGFFVKARILPETYTWPALAIGIDTQGTGYYDAARERYQFKSRGVYAVASKNYALLGDLAFHGGINRSLEDVDDENLNPFVGVEKSLGSVVSLGVEYDVALNDNRDDGEFGRGRGYLNTALRWNLAPRMQVRLVLRDLLRNSQTIDPSGESVEQGWGREFSFAYMESF